ncbi:hypothetical protein LCGC14_2229340 [marine sediment metagenome]|uniref:Uncharacterized protein n=1 Tax=marine sediment metagenome TaxID=412755 RepID=A0A0F9DWC9_9ZZZZ
MIKYKIIKKVRIQKEKKKAQIYNLFSKIELKSKVLKDFENGVIKLW